MKINKLIKSVSSSIFFPEIETYFMLDINISTKSESEDRLEQASINSLVSIDMKFHYFKIKNLIMRKNQQIEILSLKLKHARARIILLESRLKKFNTRKF